MTSLVRPEEAEPLAVLLDDVLGVEPAVGVERAGGVEVAQHGEPGPDPERPVDDARLVAVAADLDPQRAVVAAAAGQDPQLREAVGLLQPDPGERLVQPRQGAGGHHLGAVGDPPQARQVVPPVLAGEQQQAEEARAGRQDLDAVPRDRLADPRRAAVPDGHDGPPRGQPVRGSC